MSHRMQATRTLWLPALTCVFLLAGCQKDAAAPGPKVPPPAFWTHYNRGLDEQKKGQFRASVVSVEQALTLAPDHPGANYEMAGVKHLLGDSQPALEHMEVAIENIAEPKILYFVRMEKILVGLGRVKEAALYMEKIIALDETYAEAYLDLCGIYLKLFELDKVIETSTRAMELDLDPNYPYYSAQLHYSRGRAYERKGDLEAAEKDLREAIRLCPKYPRPYYSLGNSLAKAGKAKEGEELLAKYTELNGIQDQIEELYNQLGQVEEDYPGFLRRLMLLHVLMGQHREAEKACDNLLAMEPGNPEVIVRKGMIKDFLKEYGSAERYYKKAIEAEPRYTEAYERLALFYATVEDDSLRSLEACEKVMEQARPYGGIGPLARAEVYYAQGNRERAVTTLRWAISKGQGDFKQIRQRIEVLEREGKEDSTGEEEDGAETPEAGAPEDSEGGGE